MEKKRFAAVSHLKKKLEIILIEVLISRFAPKPRVKLLFFLLKRLLLFPLLHFSQSSSTFAPVTDTLISIETLIVAVSRCERSLRPILIRKGNALSLCILGIFQTPLFFPFYCKFLRGAEVLLEPRAPGRSADALSSRKNHRIITECSLIYGRLCTFLQFTLGDSLIF